MSQLHIMAKDVAFKIRGGKKSRNEKDAPGKEIVGALAMVRPIAEATDVVFT